MKRDFIGIAIADAGWREGVVVCDRVAGVAVVVGWDAVGVGVKMHHTGRLSRGFDLLVGIILGDGRSARVG